MSKLLVNEEIKCNRLVVVDTNGEIVGEFLKQDAISLAKDRGLDLVLVNDGDRPTCKLMDYGKFLYDKNKRVKKSKSKVVKNKEIKIGFQSDDHYVGIKVKQAKSFLEKGNRVKFTITLSGRQHAHANLAVNKCREIFKELELLGDLQSFPKYAGSSVFMIINPKSKNN